MLAYVDRRSAAGVSAPAPDRLFRYDPPASREQVAQWQRMLDEHCPVTDRLSRLVLRWEAGDPWQPIQRWVVWQCLDPKHVTIEPWVRSALNGPHPRATGHYCGDGYCLCAMKRNKWVGGATRLLDRQTWELHRDTGLYGTRWWVLQGRSGGHRFAWAPDEPQATVAAAKGLPTQTPAPGDLPYATLDGRTLRAIDRERRAGFVMDALADAHQRLAAITAEEKAQATDAAKALWAWSDEEATRLWDEGANLLPHYLAEQYGRAPVGYKSTWTVDRMEAMERDALEQQ
jgi:hypothetical protein